MSECLPEGGDCGEEIDARCWILDDRTYVERHSIRWYWGLGIRYWCLSEISVNFIYLLIVKYKNRKKFPCADA